MVLNDTNNIPTHLIISHLFIIHLKNLWKTNIEFIFIIERTAKYERAIKCQFRFLGTIVRHVNSFWYFLRLEKSEDALELLRGADKITMSNSLAHLTGEKWQIMKVDFAYARVQ